MSFKHHLRNKFLAGIFAAIPLAATIAVIVYVESYTRHAFRVDVPFLGIIFAIASIYLLGVIVTSLLGQYVLTLTDRMLLKLPGLSELYTAWKQVAITSDGGGVFSKVVLIEDDPRLLTLGFSSGQGIAGDPQTTCVFIPAAPNPASGRLYFVPIARIRVLDVSAEEAFKFILSGGNYIPAGIAAGLAQARASASAAAASA